MAADADNDDRKGLEDLIAAHKEYLRTVKIQAARFGMNAPPHLLSEIDRVNGELAQLEAAVATPVSNDLVKALDDAGRFQMWLAQLGEVKEALGRVRAEMKEDVAQLLANYREDVHRTTLSIHARLLSYEDELIRDRKARTARQKTLDASLEAIHQNQRLRTRVELLIIIVLASALLWFVVLR